MSWIDRLIDRSQADVASVPVPAVFPNPLHEEPELELPAPTAPAPDVRGNGIRSADEQLPSPSTIPIPPARRPDGPPLRDDRVGRSPLIPPPTVPAFVAPRARASVSDEAEAEVDGREEVARERHVLLIARDADAAHAVNITSGTQPVAPRFEHATKLEPDTNERPANSQQASPLPSRSAVELEPPPAVAPPSASRGGPSLSIGRVLVEVTPSPPAIVRATPPAAAPRRPAPAARSRPSSLRFGLGVS